MFVPGEGINISANFYFLYLLFEAVWLFLLPRLVPALTGRPGTAVSGARFASGCSRGGVGISAGCPEEPLPKPAADKNSSRNRVSLSLSATGSAWWHFPDQQLAQALPSATVVPFVRSPLRLLDHSLYGHIRAQREFSTQTIAEGCRRRAPMAKARGDVGAVLVHPFCTLCFNPRKPSAWCGCTSCSSHPLPLISSCQLVSCCPSPMICIVWMAA